ncbi:MAG: DUF2156 domain-containing protein [Bacteroidota bacterium]
MSLDLRQHILRFGHNATAYQTLNAGFHHAWVGSAMIGYVRARARPGGSPVWVAAGAPIGPADELATAVAHVDAQARAGGGRAVWFGIEPGETHLFERHTGLVVGSHPTWNPCEWPDIVRTHASVRAQIQRARNKGVDVQEMPASVASSSPELRRCLAQWMDARGLPALRFLTDPLVLDALGDRRVFVARQVGEVVGYSLLAPVPARNGWMIEWIIQGTEAPNGTASCLLDTAFRALADDGFTWATLGLAALSSSAPASSTPPPRVVRALLAWTRAHARRFYNFEGLERFKAKFRPEAWEPIRLYVDEPTVSLSTLYALADAFAGERTPIELVSQALASAARTEARTLVHAAQARLSSMRGS